MSGAILFLLVTRRTRYWHLAGTHPEKSSLKEGRSEKRWLELSSPLHHRKTWWRIVSTFQSRLGGVQCEQNLRVKGGKAETITARWLVGCDGEHNMVRKQTGIAFEGDTREEVRMIVADVKVDASTGKLGTCGGMRRVLSVSAHCLQQTSSSTRPASRWDKTPR